MREFLFSFKSSQSPRFVWKSIKNCLCQIFIYPGDNFFLAFFAVLLSRGELGLWNIWSIPYGGSEERTFLYDKSKGFVTWYFLRLWYQPLAGNLYPLCFIGVNQISIVETKSKLKFDQSRCCLLNYGSVLPHPCPNPYAQKKIKQHHRKRAPSCVSICICVHIHQNEKLIGTDTELNSITSILKYWEWALLFISVKLLCDRPNA